MKEDSVNVLFVCTGNVFRSMCAEYSLRKYLKDNNITRINVSSAGIIAKKEPPDPKTLEELRKRGIDGSGHKQTKLTKDILEKQDVVIAMSRTHQDFIYEKFRHYAVLFNELAEGKKTSVNDINELVPNHHKNRKGVERHIERTVKHIYDSTRNVCEEIMSRTFGKNHIL
ncbi:MAG: hypothetical protein V1660_00995 [archaeon]